MSRASCVVASCAHVTPYLRKFKIISNIPGHQLQLQRHCICTHHHQPIYGHAEFYDQHHQSITTISIFRLSSSPPPSMCRSIAALLSSIAPGAAFGSRGDELLAKAWESHLYRAVGLSVGTRLRTPRCPRRFTAPWAAAARLCTDMTGARSRCSLSRQSAQRRHQARKSNEATAGGRRLGRRGLLAAQTRHEPDQSDL